MLQVVGALLAAAVLKLVVDLLSIAINVEWYDVDEFSLNVVALKDDVWLWSVIERSHILWAIQMSFSSDGGERAGKD